MRNLVPNRGENDIPGVLGAPWMSERTPLLNANSISRTTIPSAPPPALASVPTTITPTTSANQNIYKLAEHASVLLELFSHAIPEDSASKSHTRESIKTVLDNVTKIWESLCPEDNGKERELAGCTCGGSKAVTECRNYDADSACIICYDSVADAVFIPCHHLVLCMVNIWAVLNFYLWMW